MKLKTLFLLIGLLVFSSSCVIHKGFQICFAKDCVWGPMIHTIKITKKNIDIKMVGVKRKLLKTKHHLEGSVVATNKKRETNKIRVDSGPTLVDKNKPEIKQTDSSRINSVVSLKDSITPLTLQHTVVNSKKLLRIYYPNDGANITEDDKKNIRNYLFSFNLNTIKKITIIGYTDNKGSHEHNKDLSFNRAKIIHAYFLALGLNQFTILYSGLAEKNPVSPNNTPEERKLNRRTEIAIE